MDAAGDAGREQRVLVAQAPALGQLYDVLHGVRLLFAGRKAGTVRVERQASWLITGLSMNR
ncbi:hypothetical protein GCM10018773_32570 [Streptomyces candidus]|nr:hypothetical protein GCM10018773_32570 [Streptomyces candidus]